MLGADLSLKENMDAIKQELNSEEKFFESAMRTERFVKRYKKPLIAIVALSVLGIGGFIGAQTYQNMKIERSNEAFNTLLQNPSDLNAEQNLKNNNPKLYDLWKLSQAMAKNDLSALENLKSSETFAVADIAEYEAAVIKKDVRKLDQYTKRQNALYKDLALIESAVDSLEKGNTGAAKQKIALISKDSSLSSISQSLMHYGDNK